MIRQEEFAAAERYGNDSLCRGSGAAVGAHFDHPSLPATKPSSETDIAKVSRLPGAHTATR